MWIIWLCFIVKRSFARLVNSCSRLIDRPTFLNWFLLMHTTFLSSFLATTVLVIPLLLGRIEQLLTSFRGYHTAWCLVELFATILIGAGSVGRLALSCRGGLITWTSRLLAHCWCLYKFYIIAALVAVPESRGGDALEAAAAARTRACYSSLRLYFRRRTVKFLGELQIRSNCVRTSLIYLINSLVLGDCLNLTVLINAFLNWLPRM